MIKTDYQWQSNREGSVKTILNDILGTWDQDDLYYLFPSEVVADFWRLRLLKEPGFSAVPSDRFLTWDQFKEKYFAMNRKEIPVNSRIRRFYTEEFLERFSSGQLDLQILISSEYRTTASVFQSAIASLLPHLKGFFTGLGDRIDRLDEGYREDLKLLFEDYSGFLTNFSLYEPSWEKPEMGEHKLRYRFYLSELVEDLPDFLPQLKAVSRMELVDLNDLLSEKPSPLSLFQTSLEEVESLCFQISGLLDSGVHPSDMVITMGDDSLLPILKRTARRLDVPLNVRIGKPLGEYPAGRFFSLIKGVKDELFSLESVKALVLHRGFPWKNRDQLESLVRFGAEYHCLRNLGESPSDDLWNSMFFLNRKNKGVDELASLYKSLKSSIHALTSAKDFAGLSSALELFLRQFLDTDLWEAEGVKILQRIRTALKELQLLEVRLEGFKTSSPLAFLIQDLSSGIYVPRGSDGPGIAVYPYRVSAGIRPLQHFMVGLSQKGAAVQFPLFPFLREDQRSLLELDDRDLTEPYLETYLRSGEGITASCARETPQGAQLAPGFLVARGDVGDAGDSEYSCPYQAEEDYWAGTEGSLASILPSYQKQGFTAASEYVGRKRRLDFTREPLADSEGVKKNLCDAAGLARASSYRMDSWKRCPTEFLFRYGWKVEEPLLEASWEDFRQMGNLRHNLAEDIFSSFGADPFPENPDELSGSALETATAVFDRWEKYEPLGKTPFWAVVRRGVEGEIETLLRQEAGQFQGYAVRDLEVRKDLQRGDLGVAFSGQIDRVVGRGGSLGIVDYKSSFNRSEKSLISPEGEPYSYQMPIYILFLEEEDGSVEWAVYYNFRKGKFVKFLKPGQEEIREQLITVLEEDAREYAGDINLGRYMPHSDCDGCDYRILCRQKYFIKGDR